MAHTRTRARGLAFSIHREKRVKTKETARARWLALEKTKTKHHVCRIASLSRETVYADMSDVDIVGEERASAGAPPHGGRKTVVAMHQP